MERRLTISRKGCWEDHLCRWLEIPPKEDGGIVGESNSDLGFYYPKSVPAAIASPGFLLVI